MAHRGGQRGLTKERRASLIEHVRATGVYAHAYRALKIPRGTFDHWRRHDPTFQSELDEACRELDREIGTLGRRALHKALDDFIEGRPVPTPTVINKTGEVVDLDMPRELNVAAVRTALTKLDPTWTHPTQAHDVKLTMTEQVWDEAADKETS